MRVKLAVLYPLRWLVKMRTSILLSLERIPWLWRTWLSVILTVVTHILAFRLGQQWVKKRKKDAEQAEDSTLYDPTNDPFERCEVCHVWFDLLTSSNKRTGIAGSKKPSKKPKARGT